MNLSPPPFLIALTVFIFGSVVGSFLNVCIARLPKGESVVSPPSHCPLCNTPIHFYDNVPLLSYVWLRGRCRFCRERISPRYFIVELLMAFFSVLLLGRFGLGFTFFVNFVLVAALIIITFVDLDVRIVPDVISIPGIGLGLLASLIQYQWSIDRLSNLPSPISSLVGILVGGGSLLLVAWAYQLFTGVEGMGGGDVKLLAMIGAFLGWPSVPVALFFASLTGSVVGLIFMFWKGVGSKYALPFAPFLCLGAAVYLFLGDLLVAFYLPLVEMRSYRSVVPDHMQG